MINIKQAREVCEAATGSVPYCAVANCPNSADPRYGFSVGDVFAAACDGHEGYEADRYVLRDPLPRWPMHRADRERTALNLLPQALDEIERLRGLVVEACDIGARLGTVRTNEIGQEYQSDHCTRLASIRREVEESP